MSFGYEVTDEDVLTVLTNNLHKLQANPYNQSLRTMAEAAFEEMVGMGIVDTISTAAMDAGTELEVQTEAAYAEIRKFLVEEGLLKE